VAVLKLKGTSFNEGEFEVVKAKGDIIITAGTIAIPMVNSPSENKEIKILDAGNYDILDNMDKIKVLVNHVDITANTADTEVPENVSGVYYFDPETGVLGFLKGSLTGLEKNVNTKVIKSVEYFNVLGQKVYHNNDGYSIQKTTYTDGSVKTEKVFNKTR
jgi:hypothetical protein